VQHLLGAKIWSSEKVNLGGMIPHGDLRNYSGSKFSIFFSPNAGRIAVDGALGQFGTSSSIPEILAI